MNIDWTKQPTPEHCWLEALDKQEPDLSGWHALAGARWIDANDGFWDIEDEGKYFIVHRKPEEYLPKVGDVCEVAIDFDSPKNSSNWSVIEIMYIDESLVVGRIIETKVLAGMHSAGFELNLYSFRPIKTDRDLIIDIILGAGNMSEGVLADAILQAGFKATDKK